MLTIYLIIHIIIGKIITISAIVTPNELYEMVNSLMDSYFKDSCVVVISSSGYTATSHLSVVYVSPHDLHTTRRWQDTNLTAEEGYKRLLLAPVLELGCAAFVIQVENPGKQLQIVEKTFVHVNQRTQRSFIFLPIVARVAKRSIGTQDEIIDFENFDFHSVLREKSMLFIPDVIFVVLNYQTDDVAIVSHRFAGPGNMGHEEILLNVYGVAEKRFKIGANLFPDKIKNLEGKVLKVALFHYPPYSVVIQADQEHDANAELDGTEWRFVVEFAKLHNCSVEVLVGNEGSWGQIYENLTGDGVTGNLVEDKADLGMTALYSWYYESLFLDLTAPYYRSGVTCLVPGPRQLPLWMSPIFPFSPALWLIIIGMTVVSTVFTGIVNRAESRIQSNHSLRMSVSEATLTVVGITLLQGLNKEPKGSSWSVLSIILLMVALLLSTAYGSSLASVMTVPRYRAPIDTAVELAASGIRWGATEPAWLFSILKAEEPELRTLIKNFRSLSAAELTKKSIDSDSWAFSIERLQGGHYSIQDYLSAESVERLHLMGSDIYWEYCVSMLRKSSPFTRWYSRRVLEIQASGLPIYWESDVVMRYLDVHTQLAVHAEISGSGGPVQMTVSQEQGTFFILMIGLVFDSLVFLGELLVSREGYLKRIIIGTFSTTHS